MADNKDSYAKIEAALKGAPEKGLSLKELEEKTGIKYRVLHNLTWRLEGSPMADGRANSAGKPKHPEMVRIRKVKGTGVRYVLK